MYANRAEFKKLLWETITKFEVPHHVRLSYYVLSSVIIQTSYFDTKYFYGIFHS